MFSNVDLFGRDSDSDSDSESSEASTTEENAPIPGGGAANAPFPLGGAAGGFLGQVQGAIAKVSDAGSGSEECGEGGATVAGDDGSDEAPPVEGKERVGEGSPGSPSPSQGGAQPKKTLPRSVYEGNAHALLKMFEEAIMAGKKLDIAKVCELLDAGIDVRYQVRVPCVCVFILVLEY